MDYAADQQLEKVSPTLTYYIKATANATTTASGTRQYQLRRPLPVVHRVQNPSVVAVHRYTSICSHNPPHRACLGRKPTNAVVVEHPAKPFSKLNAGRRSILLRDFVWVITTQHRRQHCIAPCCMLHTAATILILTLGLSVYPQPYAVSQPSHKFSCTA